MEAVPRFAPSAYKGNTGKQKDDENDGQDEEQREEYLCDASRSLGDARKAQSTGNDRNQEEYERPFQHEDLTRAFHSCSIERLSRASGSIQTGPSPGKTNTGTNRDPQELNEYEKDL